MATAIKSDYRLSELFINLPSEKKFTEKLMEKYDAIIKLYVMNLT